MPVRFVDLLPQVALSLAVPLVQADQHGRPTVDPPGVLANRLRPTARTADVITEPGVCGPPLGLVLLPVGLAETELHGPDDGANLARGEEPGPERA
jgi:hypothetical protein